MALAHVKDYAHDKYLIRKGGKAHHAAKLQTQDVLIGVYHIEVAGFEVFERSSGPSVSSGTRLEGQVRGYGWCSACARVTQRVFHRLTISRRSQG